MILEIEYYIGNTFLSGKNIGIVQLKNQISNIEKMYDRHEDNFTELLCRVYGYVLVVYEDEKDADMPDYIYDRDIEKLRSTKK